MKSRLAILKMLQARSEVLALAALFCCTAQAIHQPLARALDNEQYKKALKAYEQKDFRAAADGLKAAIGNSPPTPIALLYLAHSYYGTGNKPLAISTYNQIIKIFPASGEARAAQQALIALQPGAANNSALYVANKQGLIGRISISTSAKWYAAQSS